MPSSEYESNLNVTVWAEITDLSESHICGWEGNKIEIPAFYDEETDNYAIQTTSLGITSWHQPDHKYAITLYARDEAGNVASCGIDDEEYGDQLGIRVREKTAPVITPISPTDGSVLGTGSFDVVFKVTDGDETQSGIDLDTLAVTIGEMSYDYYTMLPVEGYTNRFKASGANISGGSVNITFSVKDNDDNETTESINVVVHTQGPEFEVLSPASDNISVPRSTTEYEFQFRVKCADGATLSKIQVNRNVVVAPVNIDSSSHTIEGTDIPEINEDRYYLVNAILPVYSNDDNSVYTIHYNITAIDGFGKSTSITRTIVWDGVIPIIYDVTTEETTLESSGSKIKIQFRLSDAPPVSNIGLVQTNMFALNNTKGIYEPNNVNISPGGSFSPNVTVNVTPDDEVMPTKFTYRESGSSNTYEKNVDIIKLEDSTPITGKYSLTVTDPVVFTESDMGKSYIGEMKLITRNSSKMRNPNVLSALYYTPGITFNVTPELSLLSSSKTEFSYGDVNGTYIPSWRIKIKPDVSSINNIVQYYIKLNGAGTNPHSENGPGTFNTTVTKNQSLSTDEYGIYDIVASEPYPVQNSTGFLTASITGAPERHSNRYLQFTSPDFGGKLEVKEELTLNAPKIEILTTDVQTISADSYLPVIKCKITPSNFTTVNNYILRATVDGQPTITYNNSDVNYGINSEESTDEYTIITISGLSKTKPAVNPGFTPGVAGQKNITFGVDWIVTYNAGMVGLTATATGALIYEPPVPEFVDFSKSNATVSSETTSYDVGTVTINTNGATVNSVSVIRAVNGVDTAHALTAGTTTGNTKTYSGSVPLDYGVNKLKVRVQYFGSSEVFSEEWDVERESSPIITVTTPSTPPSTIIMNSYPVSNGVDFAGNVTNADNIVCMHHCPVDGVFTWVEKPVTITSTEGNTKYWMIKVISNVGSNISTRLYFKATKNDISIQTEEYTIRTFGA